MEKRCYFSQFHRYRYQSPKGEKNHWAHMWIMMEPVYLNPHCLAYLVHKTLGKLQPTSEWLCIHTSIYWTALWIIIIRQANVAWDVSFPCLCSVGSLSYQIVSWWYNLFQRITLLPCHCCQYDNIAVILHFRIVYWWHVRTTIVHILQTE